MKNNGFRLQDTKPLQQELYYKIKKECCQNFVEKYFSKWDDGWQREYNNRIFKESLTQSCFNTIKVGGRIVGFFGYSIDEKQIGCVTIQIKNIKQREKIFKNLLTQLITLSDKFMLPIYAKTFLDSKDLDLFINAGFKAISISKSHYNLKKEINTMLQRQDYETLVKNTFNGEVQDLMLEQINNFYQLENQKIKANQYKEGADVVLKKDNLMTGFKYDIEYLKQVSQEGKICGDYSGIETKHGVKWAVSTWKFEKNIKLKDYVTNYCGMSVVYNGKYEIVPYGGLDKFVEKLKKTEHFLWEAESTREMRFLPNDIRHPNNIALIFNVGESACEKLLNNELQKENMPEEIKVCSNPNERNKSRLVMEKGFGERCAYIMFGIPKNCIEGLFVNREVEKNKKELSAIRDLFPNCYICNIDGKVIVGNK